METSGGGLRPGLSLSRTHYSLTTNHNPLWPYIRTWFGFSGSSSTKLIGVVEPFGELPAAASCPARQKMFLASISKNRCTSARASLRLKPSAPARCSPPTWAAGAACRDVIGSGDDRAGPASENLRDKGPPRRRVGVQTVPAVAIEAIVVEVLVAGHAIDAARLNFLCCWAKCRASRRSALPPKTRPGDFHPTDRKSIDTLADAFSRARRLGGHRVVLVHQRDVVEDVLFVKVHLADAVQDDRGKLVGVARVVGPHGGEGQSVEMAVAVLVLESLKAGECVRRVPPSRCRSRGRRRLQTNADKQFGIE